MPAQLTTRQQVNGYRFLLRRMEHSLIRRDARMLHDPMRSHFRSVSVGIALTVLITGACAVYGLIKPAGSVGDSKILVGKESGGLYVVVDETLRPVLNLASARLIAGSAEKPKSVSESKLTDYERGPLVGIPGAPQSLKPSSGPSDWTVCDVVDPASATSGVTTAVLAIAPENDSAARGLGASEALFVESGGRQYLLSDGKRHEVDVSDAAVEKSFGFAGVEARPISPGLLNAFPEADKLATPQIAKRGEQSKTGLGPIGTVVEVTGVGDQGNALYVVLRSSIQRVTAAAADVIRYSDIASGGQIRTTAPASITDIAQTADLPVVDFPDRIPTIIEQQHDPVACLAWSKTDSDNPAKLLIFAGRSLPLKDGSTPVALASADGGGAGLDAAFVPPSSGRYVVTAGADSESPRRESLVYVNDSGVAFGVADAQTAQFLGLGDEPQVAPWPIVGLLPEGPALSRSQALVERDSLVSRGATVQAGDVTGG